MEIKRGNIFLANLEPVVGAEQGRTRPVVILQNNLGNRTSPTTIIAPITSKIYSKEFPTNIEITKKESGLKVDSTILLNQIRTLDKRRIIKKLGMLNGLTIHKVDFAIKISLGLDFY